MNDINIANEARRIFETTGSTDNEANWHNAIENLKIFPSHNYSLHKVSVDDCSGQSFGLIRPAYGYLNVAWHHCREMFERDIFINPPPYHGNNRFGFLISPTISEQEYRIAHFIRNIELDRLHLEELTTFMRVENKHYIYIVPSSFWTDCQMRFSLFTILIRAGTFYYFNTIEEALKSYPYSNHTLSAINLFLQGRFHYTGRIRNWREKWVAQFSDLLEVSISTLSSSPGESDPDPAYEEVVLGTSNENLYVSNIHSWADTNNSLTWTTNAFITSWDFNRVISAISTTGGWSY